ncbi:hypothetical protein [Lacticaseibacillus rhamnosus]|nr:hypothetical protein [Lacticaseibacillus rhamnosus]
MKENMFDSTKNYGVKFGQGHMTRFEEEPNRQAELDEETQKKG